MELREYLFRNEITIASFSRKVNYSPEYIGAVIHKKFKPGKKLVNIIEKVTEGAVKASDFPLLEINDDSN